jgi:antitoxin HicB
MSTLRKYDVVLTPGAEGGFSVTVPTLPGCTSQGETREEALLMIRQAIEVSIESLVAHGDPIPGPRRDRASYRDRVTPRPPAVKPR